MTLHRLTDRLSSIK